MARLVVQFPSAAAVVVNGEVRGETNRVIRLEPGQYTIRLSDPTEPAERSITVAAGDPPDQIVHAGFRPADDPKEINRFSPLYCRYNGFILGQFLTIVFAEYGREKYGERRERMLEFLEEISVRADIPEEPPGIGSDAHTALIMSVGRQIGELSREMTHFFLLGAALAHYRALALTDRDLAREALETIAGIREQYGLPELDPRLLEVPEGKVLIDEILSPALTWLTKTIDMLDIEEDTAFVIMPFKPPYSSYFATFYRPALESAGYRAFRAWGGLSDEDYCDLLLRLIAKSGMVWADVSELNHNVLYEIGAAHATGKLSVLVTRDEDANKIPANIGHDAVSPYSPSAPGWPQEAIFEKSTMIALLRYAASRGERLRVSPAMFTDAIDAIVDRLFDTIIPPEAHEAARAGRELMEQHDSENAERCFSDAIELGLNEPANYVGRGVCRVALGKFAEAEDDLSAAVGSDDEKAGLFRGAALYWRGLAREELERDAEAWDDYTNAIALGYPDADPYCRRAWISIRRGDLDAARADTARAAELDPNAESLAELREQLGN